MTRRVGMTRQVALATCLAAAFAVFAAALAALGFVRHAYDGQARAVLRREAILVAEARTSVPNAFRTGRPAGRVLRASGITVVRVHADGRSFGPATVDPADVAAAGRGEQLSAVRRLDGSRVFVEVLRQYGADTAASALFLMRPHPMLGGRSPFHVAKESTAGADLVLKLLARAEAGVAV